MYTQNWLIKLKKILNEKLLLGGIFLGLIILQIISVRLFNSELFFWEQTNLLVRKHILRVSLQLPFGVGIIYQFLTNFEKVITKLDSFVPLFPSNLRSGFWTNQQLYVVLTAPLLLLFSLVIVFLKKYFKRSLYLRIFLIVFLIFYFIPVNNVISKTWDNVITQTKFSIITPWSGRYVWIWDWDSNFDTPYTKFVYNWRQKNGVKEAEINVSCLGHYQLFVNDTYVYNGPNFAAPPKIYYDKLKINQFIKPGDNSIKIICNFIKEPVHEYSNYQRPAMLVGGFIDDGLFKRNLADHRLWLVGKEEGMKNGIKISRDTGYSEMTDLTVSESILKTPDKLELPEYQVLERPIKLLSFMNTDLKAINADLYDLGLYRVGFLQVNSNFSKPCTVNITWGVRIEGDKLISYTSQEDQITLPAGKFSWRQFSRRAGRYIQVLKPNCEGQMELSFNVVGMDFDVSKQLKLADPLDQAIYDISLNTLKNNVQDNFEDSVDRERASYVGDAVVMSQCLTSLGDNAFLIKEVIQKYADAQNPDGSFNAMEPSGKKILIPGYSLLWVDLLSIYLRETPDKEFAKKMYPAYEKLLGWVEINSSKEGFIQNQDKKEWWGFVDWYPVFEGEYSTPLQLYYLRALETGSEITGLIGEEDIYSEKAENLKKQIYKYAYLKEASVFADGFDLKSQNKAGIVTNAIAGKYGYFPTKEESIKGVDSFAGNLYTSSPYSEAWVVEWLLKNNQKEQALSVMRKYWGGMVEDGATSIYEIYKLGDKGSEMSYSHAWGCGPLYLYKSIFK